MAGRGKGYTVSQRGDTFSVRVRVAGHPSRNCTFDTRSEAEAWGRKTAARLIVGDPTVTGGNEPFGDWVRRYLRDEAGKWATARDKRRRLGQILTQPVAAMPVRLCRPDDFEKLREHLFAEGKSGPTVRHYLQDCSAVWTAAVRKWRVTTLPNPLHLIDMPPISKGRRARVPLEARSAIFAELGKMTNPFHAPFAEFLYETSLRATEPLTLTEASVDRSAQVAYLRVKGGATRPVPLSRRALELIDAAKAIRAEGRRLAWGHYDIDRYPADLVWPISYRGFKHSWDVARVRAGFPDAVPHDLRRERVSSLIEQGHSSEDVKIVSGHTSDQTLSKHYVALDPARVARMLSKDEVRPRSSGARPSSSFLARVKQAAAARRRESGEAGAPRAPGTTRTTSDPA